eukprot:12611913-Prorocentrum_lima.AAC.1
MASFLLHEGERRQLLQGPCGRHLGWREAFAMMAEHKPALLQALRVTSEHDLPALLRAADPALRFQQGTI